MKISGQLIALAILYLTPLASLPQDDVELYPKSSVKVDWVQGTDFSKYHTYTLKTSSKVTPDQQQTAEGVVDATLQAKGLQKVGMDASPSLIVVLKGGSRQIYTLDSNGSPVKKGTLIVELMDPKLEKVIWWGTAEDIFSDNPTKALHLLQKKVSKMFEKYPPPVAR